MIKGEHIFTSPKGTDGTVTWKPNGWTFVLTREHFYSLVDELIDDAQWKDIFAMEVIFHGGLIDKSNYQRIQTQLSDLLLEKVHQGPSFLIYKLKGEDAKKHIASFFNAYTFYYKLVSVETLYMSDRSDHIFQIKKRREQSVLDKLAGKLGKPYGETNIYLDDVSEIEGSPLKFQLKLKSGKIFYFDEGGMTQEDF